MKKNLLLLLLAFTVFSCAKDKIETVEKAAYYWKSDYNYDFEHKEDSMIRDLGLQKLYIKFFDVKHDEMMGNIPIAKTELYSYAHSEDYLDSIAIVPAVYLKNEVFIQSSKSEIDTLASNVVFLVDKFNKEKFSNARPVTEWQMDCDWTLKSRDNYFYFLRQVKRLSKKQISCTLRLYPYKYREKMGIPPVDKVMLMCYNLLNPLESKARNSILDVKELEAYLGSDSKYPLHLDVVLPMYSWMMHYQNNHFSHVLRANYDEIKESVKPIRQMWYEVTQDVVVDGVYLRIGDQIKIENIPPKVLSETVALLKKKVDFDKNTTIAFFHLDQELAKNYSHEEITRIFTDFSQ